MVNWKTIINYLLIMARKREEHDLITFTINKRKIWMMKRKKKMRRKLLSNSIDESLLDKHDQKE